MALVKRQVLTANDQMQELCNFMGIRFLTMPRPSDLAKAEFGHFDLEKLVWPKHNAKGIKLPRSLYEYTYRAVPIHLRVAGMVQANVCAGLKAKSCSRVPDHQLYDLKRIAISLMLTGQGGSHEAISHYVDHKGDLETTMIYDLGLIDPLLPATERLGAFSAFRL
ncbi:hypothetical protein [Mesorhizobium waimense]|uniref:hypothetical protein n=1 Tax=Mesorhizobium waimense TaxID=1300307 RepID=UPI001FE1581E|nr:hypothetical protein [Mesorhizobium waimense]